MALGRRVPQMDSAFGFCKETCLFCVNICSGGIIDGPTHSRWGRTLLQATLGQGMVLSGAWTWNERRWCNVIEADTPQRWRSELLQVLILPPLFSSVFSKQAPSSDHPLKHVDTMVSVLYFTLFGDERDANGGLYSPGIQLIHPSWLIIGIYGDFTNNPLTKLMDRSNSSSIFKRQSLSKNNSTGNGGG